MRGVVSGIADYGNCFGCATVGGEVTFHPRYRNNILVNAMNVGIVRKDEVFLANASGPGNPVIYVGSKTGRDGIHGCVCPPAVTCGVTPYVNDLGCVGFGDGLCVDGFCADKCGRCTP